MNNLALSFPGKAKYLESAATRGLHEEVQISINRFTTSSGAESRSEDFEFLVQQLIAAPPKGFNSQLEVKFLGEPGGKLDSLALFAIAFSIAIIVTMFCPVGDGPLREMLEAVRLHLFSPNSEYFEPAPSGIAYHIRKGSSDSVEALR